MTGALQDGDPTNDGDPFFQGLVDEGYRHQRIVERLGAETEHDLASMQSIQADVHSLVGEALTPAILAAVEAARARRRRPGGRRRARRLGLRVPDRPVRHRSGRRGRPANRRRRARLRRLPRHLVAADEDDVRRRARRGRRSTCRPSPTPSSSRSPLRGCSAGPTGTTRATGGIETRAETVAAALSAAGAFLRTELGDPDDVAVGSAPHRDAPRRPVRCRRHHRVQQRRRSPTTAACSPVDVAAPGQRAGRRILPPERPVDAAGLRGQRARPCSAPSSCRAASATSATASSTTA